MVMTKFPRGSQRIEERRNPRAGGSLGRWRRVLQVRLSLKQYLPRSNHILELSRIPDKAIRVIFQLLEPFPCTSVAFAITHPRFYKVRKSYYTPVKDLYCYDPPLTIRTPTQLLYVVIKDFMGSERHFCYARRKFIPWSRRGMTIEEKRRDRCPENSTPNTCGLCCGDNVGPLLSD